MQYETKRHKHRKCKLSGGKQSTELNTDSKRFYPTSGVPMQDDDYYYDVHSEIIIYSYM